MLFELGIGLLCSGLLNTGGFLLPKEVSFGTLQGLTSPKGKGYWKPCLPAKVLDPHGYGGEGCVGGVPICISSPKYLFYLFWEGKNIQQSQGQGTPGVSCQLHLLAGLSPMRRPLV